MHDSALPLLGAHVRLGKHVRPADAVLARPQQVVEGDVPAVALAALHLDGQGRALGLAHEVHLPQARVVVAITCAIVMSATRTGFLACNTFDVSFGVH
ncbi:MAG: hypothetical protein Q4A07_06755 [Coriobacteriales bacterium]|nr:hypothetical protein [Coriobacteriales bacterium]